jgi:hypothetical protein
VLEDAVEEARMRVPSAIRPEINEATSAAFVDDPEGAIVRLTHPTASWGPTSLNFFVRVSEPDSMGHLAIRSGLYVSESKLIDVNAESMIPRVRKWAVTLSGLPGFSRITLSEQHHSWSNVAWETGDGLFSGNATYEYEISARTESVLSSLNELACDDLIASFESVGESSGMAARMPKKYRINRERSPRKDRILHQPDSVAFNEDVSRQSMVESPPELPVVPSVAAEPNLFRRLLAQIWKWLGPSN